MFLKKVFQIVETSTPRAGRTYGLDYDEGYQFSNPTLAGNKIGGQSFYIEGLDTPPEYFTDNQSHHLRFFIE